MNGLAKATKENPLGAGIYTQEMADADARRIQYGVQKPFRDLIRDQERSLELGRLRAERSEEHTSELQSLMRISYAVFCLKKKKITIHQLEEESRIKQPRNTAMLTIYMTSKPL